jgi:hypothetical protein
MSDWIKVRSTEIRLAENEKKVERERQLTAANALKAKVEPFWNELVSCLQDSVQEFNAEFPEPERKIDHFEKSSVSGVVIRRTAYPSGLVKAQLNSSAISVHYTISRTQRRGTDPIEKQGNFSFGLKDGEVCYIEGGVFNHEEVAKLFLEPFFQFSP